MKIRCITNKPGEALSKKYYEYFSLKQDFHISIGKEYTVLGLIIYDYGLILTEVLSDHDNLVAVPLPFFTITESNGSKYWVVTQRDNMTTVRPELFNRRYFHDDLLEGEDESLLQSFKSIVRLIEEEME